MISTKLRTVKQYQETKIPVEGNLTRPTNVNASTLSVKAFGSVKTNNPLSPGRDTHLPVSAETSTFPILPPRNHTRSPHHSTQHTAYGTTETWKLENMEEYTKKVEKRIFSRK